MKAEGRSMDLSGLGIAGLGPPKLTRMGGKGSQR